MDYNYNPRVTADKIKIGDSIIEKPGDNSQYPVHCPLSEPVKEGASVYAISQAFQTALPGVNR